jgi:N-acetylneuraminate synthase
MNALHNFLNFNKSNFIAEIGVNHENDIDKAKLMIDECSDLGIGSVKFQSYTANKLAAQDSPSYWDTTKEPTTSQVELFSKYDKFGIEEFTELSSYCFKKGIEFMTTPFDVDYVASIDPLVNRFKVASVDLTNHILLEEIAKTKKPVIMSTGASNLDEIHSSVDLLFKHGSKNVTLLHCVIMYPTPVHEASINKINTLKQTFPDLTIGYSDHTIPEVSQSILLAAIGMGAEVIEKHYTFNKSLQGNDHYHAFDKEDLNTFIKNIENIRISSLERKLEEQNKALKFARRGIYLTRTLNQGDIFTENDIIPLRPKLDFIGADEVKSFYGKKLKKTVLKDQGIKPEDFDS